MLDIIEATNDFDFYRVAILNALARFTVDDEEYDVQQVYDLVAHIALNGDTKAREAIFNKFNENPALGDFAGAHEIIALGGTQGFIYVAEQLGKHIALEGKKFTVGKHEYEVDDGLLFTLEKLVGEAEAATQLEELRRNNPKVIPVVDAIERERISHKRRRKPKVWSYDEIKRLIHEQPTEVGTLGFYKQWGRQAAKDDLLRAAEDLLEETNPESLRRCLAIFGNSPFPLNPSPLFDLVHHHGERVAISAIRALENVDHPSVRAFALKSIKNGFMVGNMVTLLKGRYFQANDWSLIKEATHRALDAEDYHALGRSTLEVFDQQPTIDAIPALLNLYECDPCSACRERVVDRLASLQAVPQWMREECLCDSNLDLREKVKSLPESL